MLEEKQVLIAAAIVVVIVVLFLQGRAQKQIGFAGTITTMGNQIKIAGASARRRFGGFHCCCVCSASWRLLGSCGTAIVVRTVQIQQAQVRGPLAGSVKVVLY